MGMMKGDSEEKIQGEDKIEQLRRKKWRKLDRQTMTSMISTERNRKCWGNNQISGRRRKDMMISTMSPRTVTFHSLKEKTS
jgi:ribosomal protein S8E